MSLVSACCNTPPVDAAHWHNKGEYVNLSRKVDGEDRRTYLTGPKDAKRGIIAVYDIFGYHPTGLQFFDRIAESHGGFRISAPDFFKNGGIKESDITESRTMMDWIIDNGDYKKNNVDEYIRVAAEDLRKAGCTTISIFGQCWGALMALKAASEEDSTFLCAGGPHPSFYNVEAAKDVKAPLIILASKDEADMIPVIESVKHKNFAVESFHKRYNNMHHGWTGARGDWAQADQLKAGLEAVEDLASFFAKVATVAESKL
ncbi:hypothetical protein BGZ51_005311 [Haplosporangium sp. Z 767]|nr:hypothetical protein BGZ51_005311 [Haplosporangium sp. Z 767]KAF9189883.1 hypothetical protein BGZ50_000546 [Haplosporangium sp. Z 11]